MPKDLPESDRPSRESPVELSRRLRLDARAMVEAAQRSLDASNVSYGMLLNRRAEPDRRKGPTREDAVPRRIRDESVEELFHAFLDTEPQVHWGDDGAQSARQGADPHGAECQNAEPSDRSLGDAPR